MMLITFGDYKKEIITFQLKARHCVFSVVWHFAVDDDDDVNFNYILWCCTN